MLKLITEIYIIKNKATQIGYSDVQLYQELSLNFTLPTDLPEDQLKQIQKEAFLKKYENGEDVYLKITFANDIKIDRSFTKLSDTAQFTIPRNMNWGGLDKMIEGRSSVFGRGDRVVIKCGYEYVNLIDNSITTSLKEVFRGYISSVGVSSPLTIHCEDMMFFVKNMRAKVDYWSDKGTAAEKLWKDGKITLKNLIKRSFQLPYNSLLQGNQNQFLIVDNKSKLNTLTKKDGTLIPIYLPNELDTNAISFNPKREKNVAEICQDIKTKLHIYPYFDDFGNLHFEMPFLNLNDITDKKAFEFQKNIIDDSSLIFMNQNEKPIKVIMDSKQTLSKGKKTLYANGPIPSKITELKLNNLIDKGANGEGTKKYVGSQLGDSITINTYDNVEQADLDKFALQVWRANTYTGYKKGSTFTTFGEPAVYIGQSVNLKSKTFEDIVGYDFELGKAIIKDKPQFPEKEGDFAIVGIKRTFGVNGYRQEIEIGPKLNPNNNG
jgi:hypothetical protein